MRIVTSVDYTAEDTLKALVKDLVQHGVALVFAHISESLKADLDRQGLTDVIGPNRQFETLRECLAAYASRYHWPDRRVQPVRTVLGIATTIRSPPDPV